MTGASATPTGLGSAEAPEPFGLRPTGAIPSAAVELTVLAERLEQAADNAMRSGDGFWSLSFGRGKRQSRAWGALSRDLRSCAYAVRAIVAKTRDEQ